MILKALYDYYKRLEVKLPSFGTELKEIHYIVVIDKNGNFLRFESKRIDKKRAAQFCVPKGFKRTSAPKSNILWDNAKYVFGFETEDKACHSLFVKIVQEIAASHKDDVSIQALKRFYDKGANKDIARMQADSLWDEIKSNMKNSNFSFQLEGDDEIIAEKKHLFEEYLQAVDTSDEVTGVCLITGKRGPIVRLTTATPILNSQAVASIVSIQKSSGYDSYGKSQAYNSPISKEAEFAYSTALKILSGKESKNNYTIGQRLFLFWGAGSSNVVSEAEHMFYDFLNMDFVKEDDPNENIAKVAKFFKSIWSGEIKTDLDDRFFILGLASNIGRIAVIYFKETSLIDFAQKIFAHFTDMEIVDTRPMGKQRPYCGLYSILSAITVSGKAADANPNLPEAVMSAIINGTPYPYQLLTGAIQRICAQNDPNKSGKCEVSVTRAAIIKAFINRHNIKQSHKLNTMLDTTNDNCGYLCGRLTAVLEKIQLDAKSGDSINTRYMTAASATPSAVFPSMLNLSMHHIEKLSDGSKVYFEKVKQEIIEKLPADGFPAHLDLMDQGRFFVGYYHQKADLYKSKDNNNK